MNPSQLELIAIEKRKMYRIELKNLIDEELIKIFKDTQQKFKGQKIKPEEIANQPGCFYKSGAAVDVLRRRYGPSYIEKRLGLRLPLYEKIYYSLKKIIISLKHIS